MEIVSERERILLGYAPRDPFSGVELSSQRRSSDIDFHDVFGGPPRRSSIFEYRRNRADSIDSYSRASRGREDSAESRRSSRGSGEKPVFGDGSGSGRRRQLGDDFYSDIFQSSDSACSSPKRGDRDALQSSPGSRVNSPNRPTPIRSESLFGGSLLSQSSLSEKMDKDLDHPGFGSITQHSVSRNEDERSDAFSFSLSPNASSTDYFTTQPVLCHGDLRNKSYASYRQSALSRRIPSSFEGLADTMEPSFQTVKSQNGKSSSSLEDYISSRQFHFSIHKWAGKGVMLVMPSYSNERNEIERGLTTLPEIVVQEVDIPSHCDSFSHLTKAFESETENQEKKSDKKEDDYIALNAKGLSHVEFGPELLRDHTSKKLGKCGKQSEKVSVPYFDENSCTNWADDEHNPEFKSIVHGEQNHELKSLSQLFDDDVNNLRTDDIPRPIKEREPQSKSQKKRQLPRESRLVPGNTNCSALHDNPLLEDKTRGNKVTGKVKDFIRKFNQEGSPKRKSAFEMLVRRSKGEQNKQDKVDELAHVSSIGAVKLRGKSMNNNIPLFDIPKVMENHVIEKAEEDKFGISSDGHPSEERIEVSPPQSEPPTTEVIDNTACDEESILEDFEGYLVQQLLVNLPEPAQNSPQQDQNLDAKIRQWSRGKEGNIRSLLSTLQLILWPESGWKQVPLVNIIEGPSVKKAYQRALLCLHPDKLQQKGASSNQKYIAEKVFDILQEAWDHFNSISEF
ncbi:J domain-containing protein required for chloroplast accumulation response 1 isoform X1 [Dendrobium catenatum]|uniref:J domain-containing protein required for chloroplast accumulation response 1 isoform X1 n=1 Tax=Dendrobium catenatum TaxID=906689 RepID=UPI0009F359C0|nr:J domain-containing protein required for chloroplast accumulation response 1 isoform X1 [Dendrobium catenatum]